MTEAQGGCNCLRPSGIAQIVREEAESWWLPCGFIRMFSPTAQARVVSRTVDEVNQVAALHDPESDAGIRADIAAIARISAVPGILSVISEVTGLRLALVARVTTDTWTACAVLDRMNFGLEVGGRLDVTTTLCSEVRDTRRAVIIEHASDEPAFCNHPTPKMYGFQSYIALPLLRATGEYFGTVCALDAKPARLRDEKTVTMFRLFSELISL